MRTTVTLEPDVAIRLKDLAHARRASFKATLNDVLRAGLDADARPPSDPLFAVVPTDAVFCPGVDAGKLNQLLDELETEDFLAEAAARPAEPSAQ